MPTIIIDNPLIFWKRDDLLIRSRISFIVLKASLLSIVVEKNFVVQSYEENLILQVF